MRRVVGKSNIARQEDRTRRRAANLASTVTGAEDDGTSPSKGERKVNVDPESNFAVSTEDLRTEASLNAVKDSWSLTTGARQRRPESGTG